MPLANIVSLLRFEASCLPTVNLISWSAEKVALLISGLWVIKK
jgi:hypothetical protein